MIDDEHNYRPNKRDQNAPEIEASDTVSAEHAEDNSADNTSDYAEKDVAQRAFA
jgi:hypothetical protein